MDVSLEQAFAEACKALGEAIVRERLLMQALTAEQAKNQPPPADDK